MRYIFITLILLLAIGSNAQDSTRFNAQVKRLMAKEHSFRGDKQLVIFTGSSSIVRWKTVQADFPNYNVINNGFGGSQFSDLLYFYNELILKQKPEILFIYEGDNDVASGKSVKSIFKQAKELHTKLQNDLPDTKVVFISPKPCIANWNKKDEYIKLNNKLQKYCDKHDKLKFADVWSKMLDEDGVVFQDIFIEDGDHMKPNGYAIWIEVIGKFLK